MVVLNFEKSQITFFRMINGQSANTKNPRYSQKFIQQYESIPGITKSSRGDEFAFCKYCKEDISIAHSGMYDIERHRGIDVHKDYERMAKSQGNISQYMVKPRPSNKWLIQNFLQISQGPMS